MGGWLTDWITDRIADVVTWIISAVSAGFAALASTITKFVMDLALSASPDMNAEFLLTWYRRIFAVGIPVVVILAAIQVMTSTAATSRADSALKALTGAVKAILASMLALPLVTLFVTAADSTADAWARPPE
ncbi:hypothetical protein ACU19_08280, partial [Actinobaculum suis]|uniref:hypothetical protein n=1 Tax=Actinobaculum suis TaxID=1657 RepID=UPI00066FCFC1